LRYVPAHDRDEARVAAVSAQLAALPDAVLRRFLAWLPGRNVQAIELPLAEFLADLAVRAERASR
jgi:hypothetical protein